MPIYEFYCDSCNVLFNFFSARVNTTKVPSCPQCGAELARQISRFATIGKAKEEGDDPFAGLDEAKMEKAFASLMQEAERVNEEDPQQMAALMRRFTSQTGIRLGESMEEAIARMEAGEDPEQVEKEMGDLLDGEDFSLESMKSRVQRLKEAPRHDEKLYEL
ncbi:MAG TPA: zinc ribbon domain-containing protein [Desulforhopalus sp.]|jgi:putative FmdB family regulatory protein|nr:zinc ribbon domain-containing protein [Desulforhopalus sp.]